MLLKIGWHVPLSQGKLIEWKLFSNMMSKFNLSQVPLSQGKLIEWKQASLAIPSGTG